MDNSFIMIPLPMFRTLFQSQSAYNQLLCCGLYKSARKQKTNRSGDGVDIIKQMLYCWYREKKSLTPSIMKRLQELLDEEVWFEDEDYNGFNGDGSEFYPESEIDCLWRYCKEDDDFLQEIWEWYDLYQFLKLAHIVRNGSVIASVIKEAEQLPDDDKIPYAMINQHFLIDYRDSHKKERDRARLSMMLAISSIVGRNRFAATTKRQIAMRMFGCKNQDEFDQQIRDTPLMEQYEQYTTRKIFDGMKNELLSMGLIKCYHGHAGRIYISPRFTFDELLNEIADFVKSSTGKKKKWQDNEKALNTRLTTLNNGAT